MSTVHGKVKKQGFKNVQKQDVWFNAHFTNQNTRIKIGIDFN